MGDDVILTYVNHRGADKSEDGVGLPENIPGVASTVGVSYQCKNITEVNKAKVAKLDAADHFKKKGSNGNDKKDTVNTIAGKENYGGASRNKDTTKTADTEPIKPTNYHPVPHLHRAPADHGAHQRQR